MTYPILFIVLGLAVGLVMTWGVGANDLANIMSTTMGSKSITLKQAIIIAIIFEFAGAFIGGIEVTDTIKNGIINASALDHSPEILAYGMLSVLLASMTWMLFASRYGLPVSITHTLIGALVGFGTIVLGFHSIHWSKVKDIGLSWIFSPLIAGVLSYLLFSLLQKIILGRKDPMRAARRYAPALLAMIGIAFSVISLLRGLKHLGLHLSFSAELGITLCTGLVTAGIGSLLIHRIVFIKNHNTTHTQFQNVEKIFSILMIFTACAMVFAHGSNDVSITVGPMAAIISLVLTHHSTDTVYPAVTFMACSGVVLGLIMYGQKVMSTVGERITELTPSRAFAATLAAAFTVMLSTGTGIPVSATQTLVGAILGVGLARGIGAINLIVVRNIFLSWFITVPVAAGLATVYFLLLKNILA